MNYPKIGIRPVIDGRWGGVRESLEEQTMGMATSAAKLIEENLCYPDGTPVQCVVSNTTIGGGAEAAACEEQFSTENVVATLSVTPCWCYGMETYDNNPKTIKAVWGFNGTERPGAVYLAAVMAAYAQKGMPALNLWPRCSRYGRQINPCRCCGKDFAFCKMCRICWLDEKQVICKPRRYRNGYRRLIL